MFNIIIATDSKGGIGKNGLLPWKISQDMTYFRDITTGNGKNAVIMGRKTWESIPKKFKLLQNRLNCILSSNLENKKEENWFNSLESCLDELKNKDLEDIFIIGGANLYNQVLENPLLHKIYLTNVEGDYNCDVFFNGISKNFELLSDSGLKNEGEHNFSFQTYIRKY